MAVGSVEHFWTYSWNTVKSAVPCMRSRAPWRRNREGSQKQHPGWLVFCHHRCCPYTWRGSGRLRKRLLTETLPCTEEKSKTSGCKALFVVRWFGQLVVGHTQPSHERCSMQQTWRLAETGGKCQRKPSNINRNTKYGSLCSSEGRL